MNASSCEKVSSLLSLFMDNMLSENENDTIREHIKTCSACREEYEFMKTLALGTKDMPMPELPKEFHENLMAKVRETKQEKTKRVTFTFGPGFRRTAISFAAAAAVVAVSVVSLQNLGSGDVSVNPDSYVEMTTPKNTQPQDTPVTPEHKENKPAVNPVAPRQTPQEKLSGTPLAPQADAVVTETSETETPKGEKPTTVTQEEKTPQADVPETTEVLPEGQSGADVPMMTSLDDEIDAGGVAAFSGRMTQHQMVTVYVTEQDSNTAKEVLSSYPEHESGYFVEEGLHEVIRTLSETVECHTEGMTEDGQDSGYITLVTE